jgi:L-seryl-tRNA(Ser) seleniumtransferase
MDNPVEKSLRSLPSVDRLLNSVELSGPVATYGHAMVLEAARSVLDQIRGDLLAGEGSVLGKMSSSDFRAGLCADIASLVEERSRHSMIPVFNMTGTVVHTNLGRAVLPESALQAISHIAGSPVNLEYDLENGVRGSRENHVESLICKQTGSEAAVVVNNNAAAVVLVLTTLAVGREVLISRGELVEIGGSFRIPEVMGSAGCRLKEVGATNRTHLADYESGIDENTALVMKVHTSNYEIKGFTKSVAEQDLADLAQRHGLPFVVDLGSGTLVDLGQYGLPREPTVSEVLDKGADLVTFSGDKLLGGPQSGIIAGKRELIDRLNKNPLKRALRVDKLTLAALAAVLRLYNDPSSLPQKLPILRDLTRPIAEIRATAEAVLPALAECLEGVARVEIIPCRSQIGSGALPVEMLESLALAISPESEGGEKSVSLEQLARFFRKLPIPVIGRIHNGRLLLDTRCLRSHESFSRQLKGAGFPG